jgi:hypothetical protein
MNIFIACPAYDPMVNKLSGFATVSYADLVVERLSPPAIHLMHEEGGRDKWVFTSGAKMDERATVRSGGEASYLHRFTA